MIVGQQTAESGESGKQAGFRSWGLTPNPRAHPRWTGIKPDAPKATVRHLATKHVDA